MDFMDMEDDLLQPEYYTLFEFPDEKQFLEMTIDTKILKRKLEPKTSSDSPTPPETTKDLPVEAAKIIYKFDYAGVFKALSNHKNTQQRLKAVRSLRELLSRPVIGVLLIDKIIAANIIPELVHCLKPSAVTQIQFEAAWSLTNLAAGSTQQILKMVEAGVVEHFLLLLYSNQPKVAHQCTWALANIIGDSAEIRDICLKKGALEVIMDLTTKDLSYFFMEYISMALCNIARHLPSPYLDIDNIRLLLQKFKVLLDHRIDVVIFNAIFAIHEISLAGKAELNAIIETPKLLSRVVKRLSYNEKTIQKFAVKIIINVILDSAAHLKAIAVFKPLPYYPKLLLNAKKGVRADAIWLLTLLVMRKKKIFVKQIYAMGLIPIVLKIFEQDNEPVQKEIVDLINGMLAEHTGPQCQVFADVRVFKVIHQLLDSSDKEIKYSCLRCLAKLMEILHEDKSRDVTAMAKEVGIPTKLEEQYWLGNKAIYDLSVEIYHTYFVDVYKF